MVSLCKENSHLQHDLAIMEDRIRVLQREESESRVSTGALQERLRAAEQRSAQLEGRMADMQEEAQVMEHALEQVLAQRSLQQFKQLQWRLDHEFFLFLHQPLANGVP